MVWFLPTEEGTGVLRIRDLHSGIARTATTEGRSQAWATDGKHVAYFTSKGWGPVSLHVLEVSTGYAEMIRESIVGCIRPVLSGDLVIWRHADPPTFSDASGTHEFVKTWTGHARQGILDSGGMIELRLDARDGSVTRFQYHKGARGFDADLSQIPRREEAVARAVECVERLFPGHTLSWR